MKKIIFIFSVLFLLINSCDKSTPDPVDAPFNPFDTLSFPPPNIDQVPVDSNGFLGLHHYIFSKSCNQPGCHDGSFEPDFRTVESSYNTLVYHSIVKNYNPSVDGREPLGYRVTPFDLDQSMMWKRITEHFLPNFEQMPSSGNPLTSEKIDLIKNWIEGGAKDIFGNTPELNSIQPSCYGVAAFLPNQNDLRVDTFRIDNYVYNPFITPANEEMRLWFLFLDLDIDNNYVLGNALTYNKVQFSKDRFDFTNAVELDMQVGFSSNNLNSYFSQYTENPLPYFQNLTFNPGDYGFGSGDIVYMRTFVKDDDHDNPTESPNENSPLYFVQHFAFYIQ